MPNKQRDIIDKKGVRRMLTVKMQADSLVFKDLTPTVKLEIIERCNRVATANYTPFLTEPKGRDLTVIADHSDLYGLLYALSYKYDIELM